MFKRVLLYISFFIISILKLSAQIPQENLILWLSADSVEIVDSKVATWYDKSNNAFHLTQTDPTKRPVQVSSVLNSHPAIRFNGTNTKMNYTFPLLYSQPNTIFILLKINVSSNQVVFDGIGSGRTLLQYYNSNLRLRSLIDNNVIYPLATPTNYILSTLVYNSPSSATSKNGVLMDTGNSGTLGWDGILLGTDQTNAAFFNGDILEFVYYNRLLTVEEKYYVENMIMDKYCTSIALDSELLIDYGFCDTSLFIQSGFSNILWSTGETNDTIYVNQSGQYWVQATDYFGRVKSDTITVEFPNPNLQNTSICLGDSVLYEPALVGSYDYLWTDSGTETSKYFKNAGDYWLRIEDSNGCFDTVFFSIAVDSFKNKISLGNDTSLCSGNTISLIEGEELCNSFLWTTNSNTSPIQTVNESGWQKIEVENANGCVSSDSIYVTIVGAAPTPGYIVENLCFGETTQFIDNSSPQADIATWEWIINENDTLNTQNAEWVFDNIGTQNIELIVEALSGCSNSLNFQIEILPIPEVSFTHYPACSGTALNFTPIVNTPSATNITNFSWHVDEIEIYNGENFTYTYLSAGTYATELFITISNGCTQSYVDSVKVLNEYPSPTFLSLVSPKNNSIITGSEITFQWNIANNAILYQLLISKDIGFSDIIFASELTTTNEYTFDLPASEDSIYWKVIAFNPCLFTDSSTVYLLQKFKPATEHLKLWLVADSVSLVDNKSNIWYDISGNDFDLTQDINSKQPIKIDSAINNLPILRFNGSTTSMSCAFDTIFSQPNSFFIVHKVNTNSNQVIFDGVATERSLFQYNNGSLKLRSLTDNNVLYNVATPTQFLINTLVYNSPNSELFEFGFLKSFGNSGNLGCDGLSLGSSQENTAYFNGDIAEILFFDTVFNVETIALIQQYLITKYFNAPPVNLLYDIRVPYGFCDTAITTAYKPWFTSYAWSTGETDSIIHVNRPGLYSVTVTDIFGFESSDDIRVFYPQVNDFADTIVCLGETVIWDLELAGDYSYQWYGSGDNQRFIEINSEGQYAAIITDTLGCQYKTDTINFSFDNYELTASIGPADTTLCAGNRLLLVSNADETVSWEWSTAETGFEIVLATTGEYSVTTTNWRGCEAIDTINVIINGVVPIPNFESFGHCAQNPVYFTDLSTATAGTINSWTWSINGEIFSNEQNPILAEPNPQLETSEPETKEIVLSIQTSDGCGDFITQDLTIYPLPVVSFFPDLVCQNTELEFTSTSFVNGGEIIYNEWDFPTSWLNGAESNLVTATSSGTHIVQLISTSSVGCTDSILHLIFVKPAPLPEFTAANTCVGQTVSFINSTIFNPVISALEWSWDFGDENNANVSSPQHIYQEAGAYDVNLGVSYSNGCELSTINNIEIYHNPDVNLDNLNACEGAAFTLSSQASVLSGNIESYNWQIGNPVIIESQLSELEINIAASGKFPIKHTVSSNLGCKTIINDTLIVHENPLAAFSASRTWGAVPLWIDFTNNSQDAESYYWQFDPENFSTDENPYHIFTDSGTYVVQLSSFNQYGCYDTAELTIRSVIPIMDIMLYSLRTVIKDNYLTISVYIINKGTLPVAELNLDLNLGNGKIYRETIENFQSGQVIDYTFSFKPYLSGGTLPEVVCVEAPDPTYSIYTDIDFSNNIICNTNVENLILFQPYPNPASDNFICEFITAKTEDVQVLLINGLGKIVYDKQFKNNTGYTKTTIDISTLLQGIYYFQVRTADESKSYKVEVN